MGIDKIKPKKKKIRAQLCLKEILQMSHMMIATKNTLVKSQNKFLSKEISEGIRESRASQLRIVFTMSRAME